MMADPTVISLRPGGAGGLRAPRFLAARFDSNSSDAQALPSHAGLASAFKTGDLRFEGRERVRYTRDQLLQLREAPTTIPEEILKVKREIDAEFAIEDPTWGRADTTNLQPQPQVRYSEPDNRDWRGRSAPASEEDKKQFNNQQDQLNSQFGRAQISGNQGVISYYPIA